MVYEAPPYAQLIMRIARVVVHRPSPMQPSRCTFSPTLTPAPVPTSQPCQAVTMDHGMGQQQRKSQSSSFKKMGKMAAFAVARGGSSLAKGAGYVAAAAKGKLAGAKELDGGENVEVTHPPTGNAIDRARKKKSQKAYQVDSAGIIASHSVHVGPFYSRYSTRRCGHTLN